MKSQTTSRPSSEPAEIPPHDADIERALLGLALFPEEGASEILTRTRPEYFWIEKNRIIRTRMQALAAAGDAIDAHTLVLALRSADELDLIGGPAYLGQLVDERTVAAHASTYVRKLVELWVKREALALGKRLCIESTNGAAGVAIIRGSMARLSDLADAATFEGSAAAPDLRREGLDLVLAWPNGVRLILTAIRDGREGVRGELTVSQDRRRLSWGSWALSSTQAREALRKKLEAIAPWMPWAEYIDDAAWRFTQAAREGEPLVTLTGSAVSTTRELLPRLLYEGEPTLLYADGDTGKSLLALTIAVAIQSGAALPFGLKPARPVPAAILDWETSSETVDTRLGLVAAGLGIDPPAILYKRMTRPLVDEAGVLAADFARRGIGLVVIDSKMFAVAGGEGAAFHEPITAFYNALRLFAPAASLVLNHVTNADARGGGPARPFGGAFAFNGPRLIWEAKRDPDITDATAIALVCRKANNLPRKPEPFGLRFVPGADTITVYPFDLASAAPETHGAAPLSWRIRVALASGPQTLADLARTLAAKPESTRKALQRLRDAGKVSVEGDSFRLVSE